MLRGITPNRTRVKRKKNVIIYGIKEEIRGSIDQDVDALKSVLEALVPDGSEEEGVVVNTTRLGVKAEGIHRLMKVTLGSEEDAVFILCNNNGLKRNHPSVYIDPDLTVAERIDRKALLVTLREKRREGLHGFRLIEGFRLVKLGPRNLRTPIRISNREPE